MYYLCHCRDLNNIAATLKKMLKWIIKITSLAAGFFVYGRYKKNIRK